MLPAIQLLDETNHKKWKSDIMFAITFLDIDASIREDLHLLFPDPIYDSTSTPLSDIVREKPKYVSSKEYKEEYDKWAASDRKCMAYMMTLVYEEFRDYVSSFKTAKGLKWCQRHFCGVRKSNI